MTVERLYEKRESTNHVRFSDCDNFAFRVQNVFGSDFIGKRKEKVQKRGESLIISAHQQRKINLQFNRIRPSPTFRVLELQDPRPEFQHTPSVRLGSHSSFGFKCLEQ